MVGILDFIRIKLIIYNSIYTLRYITHKTNHIIIMSFVTAGSIELGKTYKHYGFLQKKTRISAEPNNEIYQLVFMDKNNINTIVAHCFELFTYENIDENRSYTIEELKRKLELDGERRCKEIINQPKSTADDCKNIFIGLDENFKEKTGRNMTYSEMRQMFG